MIKRFAALVAAFAFLGCSSMRDEVVIEKGHVLTKDGVRLFYQKTGSDPRIVLIPNGMYYSNEFKRFAASRTLVFYDVRNRGLSDAVQDPEKLAGGIRQDVEDLETVRQHFKADKVELIGHSYIGLMIGLYASIYPDRVNRMVQIGPAPPDAKKQYPAALAYVDSVVTDVMGKLAELQSAPRPDNPEESCKQFWSVLGPINVYNPQHASKIDWGRCDLPNERRFMNYWSEHLFPSIQSIQLARENLSKMDAPVLIVHGDKDRSAPYGGAKDWAAMWPNGRLLTVRNTAHAPWIEAPETVYDALDVFLQGGWPPDAELIGKPVAPP